MYLCMYIAEDRSVMHIALRSPKDTQLLVDGIYLSIS
jgi:hypothetical protein